jgi:hypothetical protein
VRTACASAPAADLKEEHDQAKGTHSSSGVKLRTGNIIFLFFY